VAAASAVALALAAASPALAAGQFTVSGPASFPSAVAKATCQILFAPGAWTTSLARASTARYTVRRGHTLIARGTRRFYGGGTRRFYGGGTRRFYGGGTRRFYGGGTRRFYGRGPRLLLHLNHGLRSGRYRVTVTLGHGRQAHSLTRTVRIG
jgi:hypothetical protein